MLKLLEVRSLAKNAWHQGIRNRNRDAPKRIAPVENPTNALVVQDGIGLMTSVYKAKVSETITIASKTSKDSLENLKTVRPSTPNIEDWDTDSDNDSVFRPKPDQTKPKFTKINFVKSDENVKSVNKENTHRQEEYPRKSQSPRDNRRNWNGMMTQKLGNGFEFIKKACFVCGSFNHLIKDCDFHDKKMVEKPVLNNKGRVTGQREIRPVWNNAQRVNHQNKFTHPHPKRNFVPTAVVTKSGQVLALQEQQHQLVLLGLRAFNQKSAAKTNNLNEKVKTARVNNVTTAGPKAVVSVAVGNGENVVKSSACWIWRPTGNDQGIFDSGCSRHMTGNKSFLIDYQEVDGGFVAFAGSPKGGKITGKGKIRTGKLDFEDTECLVLSPDFKLLDESQVLLKVPRQNNMYSFDLKNVVPLGGLTCLFAKAIIDESNLWHRRLGHINFKTMNKLVRVNLVRGLPSKLLENNHTCVAYQKGKQHKASCKTKLVSSISQPLQMLHMDLFGSTSVRSINHKTYCLVVTDDYSSQRAHKDAVGDDAWLTKTNEGNQPNEGEEMFVSPSVSTARQNFTNADDIPLILDLEDTGIFSGAYDDEDVGAEADLNNLETIMNVYIDDIIFGSIKKSLCVEFEQMMHKRFQMSSIGELTFFLGLQVKQKDDGIFISQDKYVADILKKFDFVTVKTTSTPIETNKALLKDEEAEDVDVHLYRSMIGSLMYLTASRPDIMFAVCACARFQVTPKVSHLHAVKRIFRYLKGQPKLGLWYPRDSPFDLEAFSDSDYAGASLDRKSTTGGCQFLGKRLISWQCKKQTIVANSTTEAEYVAAANCCGQVLWIQNQMLDYGFNFMNTKIHIDNESTIYGISDEFGVKTGSCKVNAARQDLVLLGKSLYCQAKDGIVVRATTTATSLEAEQESGSGPRCQDTTLGDADAETRFETASKQSCDPPLSEVNTSRSGEDSMEHQDDLTDFVPPTPHDSPLSGGHTPRSDEDLVIRKLKKKVRRLEKKLRPRTLGMKLFKIGTSRRKSLDKENVFKQGRNLKTRPMFEEVSAASAPVTTAGVSISTAEPRTPPTTITTAFEDEDLTIAQTLVKIRSRKDKEKGKGVAFRAAQEESARPTRILPTIDPKDKGKGIMQESEKPPKNPTKAQIQRDTEIAQRLFEEEQAQFEREIDANELLGERLQQEEREQFTIEEKFRMLVEMIAERKRFKEIQKLYEREQKWINDFVPMDFEVVKDNRKGKVEGSRKKTISRKRTGEKLDDESVKRQKIEDDAEKEELRAYLDIILRDDEAVNVESLATKYPIVDWKTHALSEDKILWYIINHNMVMILGLG
ncbi:putative ribonuclease H-like domain-containing protein [Tanacetum coccineum]